MDDESRLGMCKDSFSMDTVNVVMLVGSFVTAWHILGLQIEGQPPVTEGSYEYMNKQSRANEKGWPSSLGVWPGTNKPSPLKKKKACYGQFTGASDLDGFFG
jgi:hypothetical protein